MHMHNGTIGDLAAADGIHCDCIDPAIDTRLNLFDDTLRARLVAVAGFLMCCASSRIM